ncbi:MAG: 30S ribosome-binding factor RbfA [Streptomycetaceae bacterium]|nr:MAG: 30S ribosome-binding factor RbfA [Streptomycetaceae bacterium]
MGQSHRSQKVADRIKVVVAGLLEGKIKDPRLGFVTITDTRVTGDLQHASVFYTVLGDETQREATAAALKSATGVIRSAVGKDIGTRITPSIEFFLDGLPESALALESLLETVHQRDAEVIALRANAQYAGESDPYKAPRVIDEENEENEEEEE